MVNLLTVNYTFWKHRMPRQFASSIYSWKVNIVVPALVSKVNKNKHLAACLVEAHFNFSWNASVA